MRTDKASTARKSASSRAPENSLSQRSVAEWRDLCLPTTPDAKSSLAVYVISAQGIVTAKMAS